MNSRYPLLKLLIYLITGYLVGYYFISNIYIIISLSFIAIIASFILPLPRNLKFAILALLIGVNLNSNVELYNTKNLDKYIANSFEGVYNAEITEVLSNNKTYKLFIAEGIVYSSIFKDPHRCKSIVTLFDKENKVIIKPGTEFISNSIFRVGNPKILKEDFNEKSYLISNKSLFFSTSNSNKFAIRDENYNISTFLYNIRTSIKYQINIAIPDSNIAGIIIALTTGDKTSIEKETQEAFSLTGTAHVLAISGLHVGIFSLFVFTLLGFLHSRLTKFIIFSLLIWLFVVLTGGHPSAIRAAIMATFAAFLIYYGKVPNPINILLFTILIYLIIEPTIVYSVSFQLSVLAISGIIILYKSIYQTLIKLFIIENSLTRFVSSSFAISFAATIPTAIITAYYFNSFSLIYPIANLLVLPLMTFASFQSIFVVITSSIGLPFADLFAKTAYLATNISININAYLAELGSEIRLSSNDLIYVSIITSVVLVYILTAVNLRRFAFRVIVSMLAVFLINKIETNEYDSITILPREQSTSLLVENDSTIYVVMSDRKKYDYLQYDYQLTRHLMASNKKVELIKTGNVSINFEDNYLKQDDISSKFININFIDSLSNRLNIDNLYRINEKYD